MFRILNNGFQITETNDTHASQMGFGDRKEVGGYLIEQFNKTKGDEIMKSELKKVGYLNQMALKYENLTTDEAFKLFQFLVDYSNDVNIDDLDINLRYSGTIISLYIMTPETIDPDADKNMKYSIEDQLLEDRRYLTELRETIKKRTGIE